MTSTSVIYVFGLMVCVLLLYPIESTEDEDIKVPVESEDTIPNDSRQQDETDIRKLIDDFMKNWCSSSTIEKFFTSDGVINFEGLSVRVLVSVCVCEREKKKRREIHTERHGKREERVRNKTERQRQKKKIKRGKNWRRQRDRDTMTDKKRKKGYSYREGVT